MHTFTDGLLSVLATLASLIFINTIHKPETKTGQGASIVVSIMIGLLPLWYYAEYGDEASHPLSCMIFSHGDYCARHNIPFFGSTSPQDSSVSEQIEPSQNERTSPMPPPDSPSLGRSAAPQSEEEMLDWNKLPTSDPYDHDAIYRNAKSKLAPKGWWVVMEPDMSDVVQTTEQDAWQQVLLHPGSCEVLRWYTTLYATGIHHDQAQLALDGIQTKVISQTVVVDYRHGPYLIKDYVSSQSDSAAVCADVTKVSQWKQGTCRGSAGFIWDSTFLRFVSRVKPTNCHCTSHWYGGNTCDYLVDYSCYVNESLSENVETCQRH